MLINKIELTPFERFLSLFTTVRPGEGRSVLFLFANAFLLLMSYYLLKPMREALILIEFDAKVASYAVAVIAIILIFLVPLYSVVCRHTTKDRLVQWVTLFFVSHLVIFYLMGTAGFSIGLSYFVWVGIFGVMVIAQFWAFAADLYNVKSGQRIFPVLVIGAALGALVGAQTEKYLFTLIGPFNTMLVAGALLCGTLMLGSRTRAAVPEPSRALNPQHDTDKLASALGGFAVVWRDQYLRLIALFVVLLNWINTTGEYVLRELVVRRAQELFVLAEKQEQFTAAFFGDFFFWFTLLGLIFQAVLVPRLYRRVGVSGAVLVLPVIAVIGYGLVVFLPIFTIIRMVKILENSTDYSIMNTTRQAFFLPTNRAAKYEGKTAIDTFFWRFGDLIQAGFVFLGAAYSWRVEHFALLNVLLGIVWIGVAVAIGRGYRRLAVENAFNAAPHVNRPIPDIHVVPGEHLQHSFSEDTFVDTDPGDTLSLSAALREGAGLPRWLNFNPHTRTFSGTPPFSFGQQLEIEVTATDFDGFSATTRFFVMRRTEPG